jgi:predicted MFS family arabinose efflux permease
VPIVLSIADNLGWRAVYFIGGCMPFVMYPLVWRWLRPPPEELKAQHKVAEAAEGLTLREALRSYRFWVMGSALGLAASCVTGAFTNLPTLLADAGLTKPQIMATAPVLGLSMLAGRVAGGRLLDRFWAPAVALVFLLSLSAGLLVLSQDTVALPLAVAALVLVGVSSGVEYDLMAYMVSRYFGLKAYAAIYGALFMFTGAGGGLAPIFLSAAHDLTGSFQVVLVGASGLIVLAGAALLTLGRYSFLQQREAQPSGTELPAQTAHQP